MAAGPVATPMTPGATVETGEARVSVSYGKGLVVVYRLEVPAQRGVTPIPESDFTGGAGGLLAVRATVEVDGTHLLPAWSDGDNSLCVATDTMKNALLYDAATFSGSTLEELAIYWAHQLVERYDDFDGVRISVAQIRYRPAKTGDGPSTVAWLLDQRTGGLTMATVRRDDEAKAIVTEVVSGTEGLEIVRTSGELVRRISPRPPDHPARRQRSPPGVAPARALDLRPHCHPRLRGGTCRTGSPTTK